MNRHEWRDYFSNMELSELLVEILVRQDSNDPEMYGMLLDIHSRLNHYHKCNEQLMDERETVYNLLGVIPEKAYAVKEIRRLQNNIGGDDELNRKID